MQPLILCEDCECIIDDGDKCPECLQHTFEFASEFDND